MKASDRDLLRFLETRPTGPRRLATDNEDGADASCFGADVYLRLVIGEAPRDEASQALAHAASCDSCGVKLLLSLQTLEGNESPEESAAIEELASHKQWQKEIGQQLAASNLPKRGPGWVPALLSKTNLFRLGVAATVLGAVLLIVWQRQSNTPANQLAMAYTQARTLDLRIPGAEHAELRASRHTRGRDSIEQAPALLEARARLARELKNSPSDGHLLELEARADLLGERYDAAIEVLERLIAQGPATAELLADAGAAYYQRGLASGSELDRSTALDDLRHADALAPTDPVILFNEAIIMEDRGQVMNAVEVWNRFITIERDAKWAAEGKQRLADLETTLKRFKTHQSRIDGLLATPESINALTKDANKLASIDEELMTYELDSIFSVAFPVAKDAAVDLHDLQLEKARGSPCELRCAAARTLLHALASSLANRHQDFWLSDLLSPDLDTLSPTTTYIYEHALLLLGQAMRKDNAGKPADGAKDAEQARLLFQHLKAMATSTKSVDPVHFKSTQTAAAIGEQRAAIEYMFSLQRQANFDDCRTFAKKFDSAPQLNRNRYPWPAAVQLVIEKVCDDTPETRTAGQRLIENASALALDHKYQLLQARIQMRLQGDAQTAGDEEAAEHLTITTFRGLFAMDAPPIRIAATIDQLPYAEENSFRNYAKEVYLRETVDWFELLGNRADAAQARMELAQAEIHIGATKEADKQLGEAFREGDSKSLKSASGANFIEAETFLAESYLEDGDTAQSKHYLDLASTYLTKYSDQWILRTYIAGRGQLDLVEGRVPQAAKELEEEIRLSEGRRMPAGDVMAAAKYAQQDHDLYAELAAAWLAEGRNPASVLALWERFRLRSHGLPVRPCSASTLDCDLPALLAAQHQLGSGVVEGQIVLLDRVLRYTMELDGRRGGEEGGVHWSTQFKRRQQLTDAAEKLDLAVSSPMTTLESANSLGKELSATLLPTLPSTDRLVLLEPDPLLQNLCWPVLQTPAGTFGLVYAVAEQRSILAPDLSQHLSNGTRKLPQRDGRPLVVGASMAGDDTPLLPEAIQEARSVDRHLRSPELLVGGQATLAGVGAALDSATVFHFAGHAVQSTNGTELLLAQSSRSDSTPWLDGAFLRSHPPRECRLAVLSACATGTRDSSSNDPLQDIVETLRSLGVAEVVATRWQIDSEASVPLMDNFYSNLANGETVAMALTGARRLQSGQPLYRNPYYWGAYYASGRETTYLQGELHASFQQVAKVQNQ